MTTPHPSPRSVAAALPGPAARRGRAERRGAGCGRGRPRDDRAGVPRRAAGAAAAAAGGADRPRRARLAGGRDGGAARDERRRGEQRAAAGPGDDAGAPAGAALASGRPAEPSAEERELLDRFIDAHERCDAAAAVAIAAQDLRITMPPDLMFFEGLDVDRAAPGARLAEAARRRLAPGADPGQPDADGRQLPPPPGRHRVPGLQVRRPAHRATARSPRSRPSAPASSRPSACRRRSDACRPGPWQDSKWLSGAFHPE